MKGGKAPGHIGSLIKAIQPAVDKARNQPGEMLDNAVRANVTRVVQQAKSSAPLSLRPRAMPVGSQGAGSIAQRKPPP